jgi:hypothetical protein
MRIERRAMKAALDGLASHLDRFGRRAEPAWRMVAARYDVAILSTNALSVESLISMGYVTREVSTLPPYDVE